MLIFTIAEFSYIKVQAIYINIKNKKTESNLEEEMTSKTKEEIQPKNYIEDKKEPVEEIWQIEIPKIDLIAPISEGTSQEVMLEYVGHFENNMMNGQGTYTWASGRTYTGTFENGKIVRTSSSAE